ncbi:hypothetical protein BHM03_00046560 [Ensete ventricosum]|nr:hypothetical protein BHM03_00046560 [Ensete ventricosum]
MTHHAAAPLAMPAVLVVRRAPAGRGCRPYLCQVGCTAPGVLRTSGRPATLVWPRQQPSCPRARFKPLSLVLSHHLYLHVLLLLKPGASYKLHWLIVRALIIIDDLVLIGHNLSDDEIIVHILSGLGTEYKELTVAIRARDLSLLFEELYDKLIDYETYLKREDRALNHLLLLR